MAKAQKKPIFRPLSKDNNKAHGKAGHVYKVGENYKKEAKKALLIETNLSVEEQDKN